MQWSIDYILGFGDGNCSQGEWLSSTCDGVAGSLQKTELFYGCHDYHE